MNAKKEKLISLFSALLVSIFFFFNIFGSEVLDPSNLDWVMDPVQDSGAHYIGWAFFRNEDWSYPLGNITTFQYPIGTNLMNADAIPVAAILTKIFSSILPEPFQYFGIWILICLVVQAFFSFRIVYFLTSDGLYSAMASLLVLFTPFFFFRFELTHRALGAQWLILGMIYLHLVFQKNRALTDRQLVSLVLLTFLSAWVHPYLWIMILALACALFGDAILSGKSRLQYGMWFMGTLFFALIGAHSVGYFQTGSKESPGFGDNSMDLSGPFNSLGKSVFLPAITVNEYQYEGFTYLGVGMLLLVIVAVGLRLKSRQRVQNFAGWTFVSVGFAFLIFSMASPITFNGKPLIHIDSLYNFIQPLPNILRSTGRFAWVPFYLLIFYSILWLHQSLTRKKKIYFLAIALGLQLTDLSAWLGDSRVWRPVFDWKLSDEWKSHLQGKDEIDLIPIRYQAAGCMDGKLLIGGFSRTEFLWFSNLAAEHRMNFTGGITSRPPVDEIKQFCKKYFSDLKSNGLRQESLYVVHRDFISQFKTSLPFSVDCQELDGISICNQKTKSTR